MAELKRRTWRWLAVRIAGLSPDSPWGYALWPVDETGKRSRREPVAVIDDEAAVDAFFAREAR